MSSMGRPGLAAWLALVIGCGPSIIDISDGSSTSGDASDGQVPPPPATTLPADASTGGPGSASTDTGSDDPPNPTTADPTAADSTTGPPPPACVPVADPKPDGGFCHHNEDCASCHCYTLGVLNGECGECDSDADCPAGGCTMFDPFTTDPPHCNMGELGGGCETDDACADGLMCGTVLEIPNIGNPSTCGECIGDMDCPAGLTCQPDIDVPHTTGVLQCVPLGSIPNGGTCDIDNGAGCSSGFCVAASAMDVYVIGVCSECASDTDCPAMQTCQPPVIDFMVGPSAGLCM